MQVEDLTAHQTHCEGDEFVNLGVLEWKFFGMLV
jgi:hypothetical protein